MMDMNFDEYLPRLEIIEQPAPKAVRFRYESEERSSSKVIGVNSTEDDATFPKIRIVGLNTTAHVIVSCVTKDKPYRPHPHSLINDQTETNCDSSLHGIISVKAKPSSPIIEFSDLRLQCVKRKDMRQALAHRKAIRVNPFRNNQENCNCEDNEFTVIDLNAVRLCFQTFFKDPITGKIRELHPVVSDPIYDKKLFDTLKIYRMTARSSTVAGGESLTILCENISDNDIQVRFYEENDGLVIWETFIDSSSLDVFKQISIDLKTPRYHNLDIEEPIEVFVQLVKPSTGDRSDGVPFQFVPLATNKRRYPLKLNSELADSILKNCLCIRRPIIRPDCLIHNRQITRDEYFDNNEGIDIKREPGWNIPFGN